MINFPTSPALNDTHTEGGNTWIWNGVAWRLRDRVTSTIADADTTRAPSSDVLFDALALKADDADVMHNTGDEDISGVKRFTDGVLIKAPGSGSEFANPTWQFRTETGVRRWRIQYAASDATDGSLNFDKWNGAAWDAKWSYNLAADNLMVGANGVWHAGNFTPSNIPAQTTNSPLSITGARTTFPLDINVAGTGNGRIIRFNNSDTSTANVAAVNMASGGTASGQIATYGTQYATPGLAGFIEIAAITGNGIQYGARAGDHVWTTGAGVTERMRLTAAGALSVGSEAVYHTGNLPAYSQAATGSTLAQRDANADINARLFRSNFGDQTTISGAIAYRVNASPDNYVRFCSDKAAIRTFLETYSGTYTPVLTAITNIAASQAFATSYMRVGDVVTVAGRIDIDPTAAGATAIRMSLPIASALTLSQQLGGAASSLTESARIQAHVTNDQALFEYTAVSTTNTPFFFTFQYQIL